MTVHVVHLVTSFDTGGLQQGIVNIVNRSDPNRVRHTVISMWKKISLADRLQRGDVISLDFPEGRVWGAFRKIARALADRSPDLLHTRNWGTFPDGVLARRFARVPRHIHGHHGRDLHNAAGESPRRRMIGRWLARLTDAFVALTPSMRTELARDFSIRPERITVIPNGVDLERLAADAADPSLSSEFSVVSIGRLDPVKDFGTLIAAFSKMATRKPGDRLWIVGSGPERARLEAKIADLGLGAVVRVLGERRDVAAVMKAADCYVQPSIYEGMSNTIVEAMACGIPVVASDVGGNPDVVGRDGAAMLFAAKDVSFLAKRLDDLRSDVDLRRRIGQAGKARALELYGLERMVESYTALYERVAARRGKAGPSDR